MNDFDHLNNILVPMWLASDDGKSGGASHGPPSVADLLPLLIAAALAIAVLAVWSVVAAICRRYGGSMSGRDGDEVSGGVRGGDRGGRRSGRIQPTKIVK